MNQKAENFKRLAERRSLNIIEAFRVFSNLHSANYEWTTEEVITYFEQFDEARKAALELFEQQKRWTATIPPPSPEEEEKPEHTSTSGKYKHPSIIEIQRALESKECKLEYLESVVELQWTIIDKFVPKTESIISGLRSTP